MPNEIKKRKDFQTDQESHIITFHQELRLAQENKATVTAIIKITSLYLIPPHALRQLRDFSDD